jgi:hypothetical protein
MAREKSPDALALLVCSAIAATVFLADGDARARARDVVVTVVEVAEARSEHSAVIEQVLRDGLTRHGYAVVAHPDPEREHLIADDELSRAAYLSECRADLLVSFSVWYPPTQRGPVPRFRVTLEVASADGTVHRQTRRAFTASKLEGLLPRLLPGLLASRGRGLYVPPSRGRVAAVFFSALGVQAGLLLLPAGLLSHGEGIGRDCPTCVAGAYSAYYIGAPAISASAAWAVAATDPIWRPDYATMLISGYLGAFAAWAPGVVMRWKSDEGVTGLGEIVGTFVFGIAPALLPAIGVLLGYLAGREPRGGLPYLGRRDGSRRFAWVWPSPTALAGADGRSIPAISLGGLTF